MLCPEAEIEALHTPKQNQDGQVTAGKTFGAPPIQYILEDLEGQTSDAYVAHESSLSKLLQCWQGLSNDLHCMSNISLHRT